MRQTETLNRIRRQLGLIYSKTKYALTHKEKESFVLLVSHGASGSTFVRSVLNRAPGWHIHGQNGNMLFHMYNEYLAADRITKHRTVWQHLLGKTEHREYPELESGTVKLQVQARMRSFVSDYAPAEATVVGFEETGFFDIFNQSPVLLTRYLEFLSEALSPCKLVMITRQAEECAADVWWSGYDKQTLVENLTKFNNFLVDYANANPDFVRIVDHSDIAKQSEVFSDLLKFVGAAVPRQTVTEVASAPTSHGTSNFRPFGVPARPDQTKKHRNILREADRAWALGNTNEAKTLYQELYDTTNEVNGIRTMAAYALQRISAPAWKVITIDSPKIAYFHVPKCGCTSVKNLLFSAEYPDKELPKNVHRHYSMAAIDSTDHLKDHFKFALVRDPIKRLISCYRNRVLYHSNLEPLVEANIIQGWPSLDEFALQIDFFVEQSLVIEHHAASQSMVFNNDLSVLDKIYRMEEINQVAKDISDLYARPLKMPRDQTGGPKLNLGHLSEQAFEKLLEYYSDDYQLLSDYYSEDAIKAEYISARGRR